MPTDRQPDAHRKSGWAWTVATVAGIPIRIHATFVLLFVWLAWIEYAQRSQHLVSLVLIYLALFVCVLLHELGHSLVALHYKIPIQSITLYPIGGLSQMTRQPKPREEVWVTLAGPVVNIVIAAILYGALSATQTLGPVTVFMREGHFWQTLMIANLVLAVFNLLPAFPMDGGRVLRAVLAMSMPFENATEGAAKIGQALAFLMGAFGLFFNAWLLLIAVFVYLAAGAEANSARTRAVLSDVLVREAMMSQLRTLAMDTTVREAVEVLLAGAQHEFPIVQNGHPVGMLSRRAIIEALANDGQTAYVAGAMDRDFVKTSPEEKLPSLLERLQVSGRNTALVMDGDAIVGLVTPDNLAEFLAVRTLSRST